MFTFAWHSLTRERLRFVITVSGVALAVLLMLLMNGLFAASSRQISLYIDRSDADLFVAQAGVRNMHMASSVMPLELRAQVESVPGVARVEAILYFPAPLEWEDQSDQVYAIGLSPDASMGGPWLMGKGASRARPGEVVIPARQRGNQTPPVGSKVWVGGQALTVAGLSQETKSLASSLVFLNADDALAMRGSGRVNYLLVRVESGANPSGVARAIGDQVPGVSVLTRQELSDSDRVLALSMGVELLAIMAGVGFLIGLAVVALTIYLATVEQLRQYGVLKALGAGPGHLMAAIGGQALTASIVGFVAGVLLTVGASMLIPQLVPGLEIDMPWGYLGKVFGLVALIGTLSAMAPYWRVHRLDPADVFRA